MFSDHRRLVASRGLGLPIAGLLLMLAAACGHKAPPIAPPAKHPATTSDLAVQQRGDQLILRFSLPQTTVGGLPLEPLTAVEYWEIVKPVPEWTPPSADSSEPDPTGDGADGELRPEPTPNPPAEPETFDIFSGRPGSGDDIARPDPVAQSEEVTEGVDEEDEGEESGEPEQPAPTIVEPSKEELIRVESYEFVATARLKSTLEEPALTAALLGERVVMTFPIEPPTDETGGAADEEDRERRFGSIFAVKTAVGPRHVSAFSNLATIAYRDAPTPPETFTLEPQPDGIKLVWESDDSELEGFHVYRRDVQSKLYGDPVTFVPAQPPVATTPPEAKAGEDDGSEEREFVDRGAEFGRRYIYTLTAVSKRTPIVESAFAVEREVDYADRFPPAAPRNPIALAEAGRVRLLWDASPQPDVDGYIVTRREGDGEFAPLNDKPLTGLEYSDRKVLGGRTYEYRVIAVDRTGNESPPSQTATARVP